MDKYFNIATIYKFNNDSLESTTIIEPILLCTTHESITSFTDWIQTLTTKKFQIVSTVFDISIIFTVYTSKGLDCKYSTIILDILFNDIPCTATYRINSSIEILDAENMSDIISIFIKICTRDITYITNDSIVDLINLRMTTIATKLN